MSDTLNDMQQYLVDEFVEDYHEGNLSRRDALRRIAAITGSMAIATSILAACGAAATPPSAGASATAGTVAGTTAAGGQTATASTTSASAGQSTTAAPDPAVSVPENDPALQASMVEFPGEGATLMGYLARPTGSGPFPLILVCHENRGLTPYIQDVTRRVAKAGYVGLAVDLLSRQGGTAKIANQNDVPGLLGKLPEGQPVQDFQSGLRYLQSQSFADKTRAGMVGFCYGGGITWRVATKTPELRAAVPFYGPPPPTQDLAGIQAAVLAIYGGDDQRITSTIPQIEAAMQQNKKIYQKQVYPGAKHAFHNDTGPNYKPDAAKDAWAKTLAWFNQYVKA